jgi:hypothetical protein
MTDLPEGLDPDYVRRADAFRDRVQTRAREILDTALTLRTSAQRHIFLEPYYAAAAQYDAALREAISHFADRKINADQLITTIEVITKEFEGRLPRGTA